MKTYSADELQTRDTRRYRISTLMLEGSWGGSSSRRALAAEWGCKLAEVYQLEGEAAGSIRQVRKAGWEDFVEAKMAELDELKERVLQDAKPNYMVAHSCIRTQLEIVGALKRPGDTKSPESDKGYEAMSHEQRARLHEEAAGEERRAAEQQKEARH